MCPNASWNPNATTFADNNIVGLYPLNIFINTDNTIYVPNRSRRRIVVWSEGDPTPTRNISISASDIKSLFVAESSDIYIDTSNSTSGVIKWMLNSTTSVLTMYTYTACYGLFVDTGNILYCSMDDFHQVVAKSLNSNSNDSRIVAGTGSNDSTSTTLSSPRGICVNVNLDLYVADCGNHRIQLFRSGQLNATTVAGTTSSTTTISLLYPTGIVLDADNYLYIVDKEHHRIVGSGPSGFRCLVGCTGTGGSASNQLRKPWSLSFDSYGNMFVVDQDNNRTQKFSLTTNLCGKFENLFCTRFTFSIILMI